MFFSQWPELNIHTNYPSLNALTKVRMSLVSICLLVDIIEIFEDIFEGINSVFCFVFGFFLCLILTALASSYSNWWKILSGHYIQIMTLLHCFPCFIWLQLYPDFIVSAYIRDALCQQLRRHQASVWPEAHAGSQPGNNVVSETTVCHLWGPLFWWVNLISTR